MVKQCVSIVVIFAVFGSKLADAAPKTIGLVIARSGDPVYAMMECGARRAAKEAGVELIVQGPAEWNAQQQVPIVRAMIAKKPDAIVIDPDDPVALQAPVREAINAGIKVVAVDDTVTSPPEITEIGTDSVAAGRLAAQKLAELIKDKGTVLVIGVAPGITVTDERQKGFLEEMSKHPNIKVLPKQFAGDSADKVSSIIRGTLAANPDLAGIHGDATLIGEFIGSTLRSLHRKDIPAVVFDASPTEVQWLRDGYLQGLIPFDPDLLGYLGVKEAMAQRSGKAASPSSSTSYTYVTRENINDPKISPLLYTFKCSK